MAFRLEDRWVWDFWFAHEGERTHLFFLQASRSLDDPDQRHWHVSIGHAVSDDLTHWTEVGTALRPAAIPAWDDCTTWTGSVVRSPQGRWLMFYTGTSHAQEGMVQRIGVAASDDLHQWERLRGNPVVSADGALYETLDLGLWYEEACRDPWVFEDPEGDGWHMVFTAREAVGPGHGRGVIGHAVSKDMQHWSLRPPLFRSEAFGHMEVPQIFKLEGRWYCLFCTATTAVADAPSPDAASTRVIGTHYLIADHPLGEWHLAPGEFLVGDPLGRLYAGRVARASDGSLQFMAFLKNDGEGRFVGELTDPMPVVVDNHGFLQVDASAYGVAQPVSNPLSILLRVPDRK